MEVLEKNDVPENVRPGSLWADGWLDVNDKWHSVVGCYDIYDGRIVLEHRGGYSTKYHSQMGLEAMWKKYKPKVGRKIYSK